MITSQNVESTTPLAGAATFNGSARNTSGASKVRVLAFADQAGTINVQQSIDGGTTWRTTDTQAVVAGTPAKLEAVLIAGRVRVQYVNGATPNTVFELSSCLIET